MLAQSASFCNWRPGRPGRAGGPGRARPGGLQRGSFSRLRFRRRVVSEPKKSAFNSGNTDRVERTIDMLFFVGFSLCVLSLIGAYALNTSDMFLLR